jgi:hypothetical protein
VKFRDEIINMLEAFDLTGSFRDTGELAGVSHHTVARYVALRDVGGLPDEGPQRRDQIIDPFLAKIEEWVERSDGKIAPTGRSTNSSRRATSARSAGSAGPSPRTRRTGRVAELPWDSRRLSTCERG